MTVITFLMWNFATYISAFFLYQMNWENVFFSKTSFELKSKRSVKKWHCVMALVQQRMARMDKANCITIKVNFYWNLKSFFSKRFFLYINSKFKWGKKERSVWRYPVIFHLSSCKWNYSDDLHLHLIYCLISFISLY